MDERGGAGGGVKHPAFVTTSPDSAIPGITLVDPHLVSPFQERDRPGARMEGRHVVATALPNGPHRMRRQLQGKLVALTLLREISEFRPPPGARTKMRGS